MIINIYRQGGVNRTFGALSIIIFYSEACSARAGSTLHLS